MKNSRALLTLISVFFFWGFVAASNDILIPVFKKELHLEQWQSQLISFAFYIAYTAGTLLYMLISLLTGKDLLNRIGYKNGIAAGLVLSALGTLLFIPAANSISFEIMITGLFVVGLGFSLQQTAANPLVINFGDPKKGAQRLSLAGGINNVGTTIGPVLLSLAIFGNVNSGESVADISSIKIPYLLLGLAFIIVAALIKFSNIPDHLSQEETKPESGSVFAHSQVILGMIAIFLYVGVEVATAGNLSEYLNKHLGMKEHQVAPYVSLFWASLMIGRWTSAAGAFDLKPAMKKVFGFVLPYAAFGLFLLINYIVGNDVSVFYNYTFVIPVMIAGDILSKGNPARQLIIFSVLGIIALFIGMTTEGITGAYALISVGLFCSTLWPCIFTLTIAGLGAKTNQASGYLVMMIMGGGLVSLLQGYLAKDELLGIEWSYLAGVVCFAYLAFFAIKTGNILKKQGIDYDTKTTD